MMSIDQSRQEVLVDIETPGFILWSWYQGHFKGQRRQHISYKKGSRSKIH
jgi:hypothetical protein